MATRSGDEVPEEAPEVEIDRDACMGSGNCVFWAPAVFDLDDEGVAAVRGSVAGHEEEVRSAAKNCPTSAIRIGGVLPT
jgi:ferredoxin